MNTFIFLSSPLADVGICNLCRVSGFVEKHLSNVYNYSTSYWGHDRILEIKEHSESGLFLFSKVSLPNNESESFNALDTSP